MVNWSSRISILDGIVPPVDPGICDLYDNHRTHILNKRVYCLNESLPLTMFQHAFIATQRTIRHFKAAPRKYSANLLRWRHEQVQQAQGRMLQCIYYITQELGDSVMSSRDYRKSLSPDERQDLLGTYSERIMFTALALSKQYTVRGMAHPTPRLYDASIVLKSAYHALLYSLCTRASRCILPPYHDLAGVIQQFDRAWVIFEEMACWSYFESKFNAPPSRYDDTDMFQVLMMQTVERAISLGIFTMEQVQESDPAVLVALPRLTIIAGVLHMPECVLLDHPTEAFRLFKRSVCLVSTIRSNLLLMSTAEVSHLEKRCGGVQFESPTAFPDTIAPSKTRRHSSESIEYENNCATFRMICLVADELQSGNCAKEFTHLLGQVIRTFE
ncbi:hypothetical protein BASA50_006573 [Batrachochytrium salamandrivorans]|uniref:Uncharacterized protein n=1 Tax=Batrachochytrium salamandrivorans TaxID=1357716 RepID=A0ABQ8FA88_9FUNG|nr:hypothetical protein BASA50_006573 [Batrachochytrium salamandrivorans]KAJ1340643.1 hypothetical protein BSLG_004737 [Batrachochytrium salamandrivorans]